MASSSRCPCGSSDVAVDEQQGFLVCQCCGTVLEDVAFATDVQFTKGADGEGEVVGQFVSETGQPRGMARMPGGSRLWGQRARGRAAACCARWRKSLRRRTRRTPRSGARRRWWSARWPTPPCW